MLVKYGKRESKNNFAKVNPQFAPELSQNRVE